MSLLKFMTCGSVDDGKSTLIGRMLFDAKLIYKDQERALKQDSKAGSRDGEMDYSLLLDGLTAEREQGITIDVAYRYFTTDKRSFIVADTPGHEEYTRNMAVGASFAELAVILVDVLKGVLTQTIRHIRICSLMGIRHFVFAVNKMDLIQYSQAGFLVAEQQIKQQMAAFDYDTLQVIPVSASEGDNVAGHSINMPWYTGPALMGFLEEIEITNKTNDNAFVLPVQRVCRPDYTFRGFQGKIAAGSVRVGDLVTVLPSKERAPVKNILYGDKERGEACIGQSVTIRLEKEVDISRGCVIVKDYEPVFSNMFTCTLLWMDESALIPGREYYIKLGTKLVPAAVLHIKYRINIISGEHIQAECLQKNEIACCEIVVSEKIVYDRFTLCKQLGTFILIDRVSNMTSACGTVEHSIRRSCNLTWHETEVTRADRARRMNQKPVTIWLTGLSGSGKSTLANELEKRLAGYGKHTMLLDGDNVRLGLNRDLGFKEKDRIENIRRVAEVAKLLNDAGLIVIAAFVSPYERDRERAKEVIGDDCIIVYVNTPLSVCEQRDVKGLYHKARAGKIPNFTGITSPYEIPVNPHITIDTSQVTLQTAVDDIMKLLKRYIS